MNKAPKQVKYCHTCKRNRSYRCGAAGEKICNSCGTWRDKRPTTRKLQRMLATGATWILLLFLTPGCGTPQWSQPYHRAGWTMRTRPKGPEYQAKQRNRTIVLYYSTKENRWQDYETAVH